ncbi:glycosyltransferase family 2 protein [Eubacterium limosum]|uniref:glycosyltransferase family 2 protein n=1 Tax=Eubacterium limosum TaxID=1736 RepID=UPI0022E2D031|nr:glycosyltransferase [Eubacterium limosum]
MEKISVIIPVFNVEKFLKKCVDSVVNQTYRNLEIILVDDGSTDNSSKLCDKFKKKDSRIVVIHKKNGGLSDARNIGISKASGKYISFVDSDDFVNLDMYEILHNELVNNGADIAVCGFFECYKNKRIENGFSNKDKCILTSKEAIVNLDKIFPMAWNKLYKKEIFSDIKYPVGKYNEDTFIILKILMKAERIVITNKKLYYYVKRNDSIMTEKFNIKHLDIIEAWKENLKIVKNSFPDIVDLIESRYINSYFQVLDKIILADQIDEYLDIYTDILNYLKDKKRAQIILNSTYFSIKRKISYLALCFSIQSYKMIITLQNTRKKLYE